MSFILLKTFGNYIEANIALSMLEQEGINCHIEDENTITMINMASGIRLMVYQSQAERALEILKEAELAYLQSLTCPHCKQKGFEIKYVIESHEQGLKKLPFGRILTAFLKAFTKDGTTMEVRHYVCSNCHTGYEEIPMQEEG